MIQYLINRDTGNVAAELTPGKKVEVFEGWMRSSLASSGIVVTYKFQDQHDTDKSSISREDGEVLFAHAFKECYYASGLRQQGYYWSVKDPSKRSSKNEIATKLVEIQKKSMKKQSGSS